MLATQPSKRRFTWLGRRPPGKLFFQGDKVGEPITPLETQLRIKLMMHGRSQLSVVNWCSGDHTRLVMGGRGFKSRSGQTFFQTFTLEI